MVRRFAFVLALLSLGLPGRASAQITFTYDFDNGSDLVGSTANSAYYTPDMRAAIMRAGDYARTQFDARGTVLVKLGTQTSTQIGSFTLAVGGTAFFDNFGWRANGITHLQAMSGNYSSASQSSIDFNVDRPESMWHTASTPSSTTNLQDLQSTALHEMTHGFGFTSLIRSTGQGLFSRPSGDPDVFSQLDGFLRAGPEANALPLITQTQGDARYNTAVPTSVLSGTNIYFHGEFAMAANGGLPIQMASGRSHVNSSMTGAVMTPGNAAGFDRREYRPFELGMLIDMGWNQFVWKNATGNWGDNTTSTASTPWQNLDVVDVLSPVGTVTTNMVLRFGGSGGYTSTNNLDLSATGGRFLLTRMILNATGGESTIAAGGGNTLRFGTTIGVKPQIRQEGAGAFVISHAVELTNSGLDLAGDGAGRVTLSGAIGQQTGQTGALTKIGSGTFVLGGNNTYTGGTTVSAGTLLVNGQTSGNSGTGTGTVIVDGGTLGGTGRVGGTVTVTSGTLAPGDGGAGTFTIDSNLAFGSTGTRGLGIELNGATAGTLYDQLVVNGTISLNGAALNASLGYTPGAGDQLFIIVNNGPNAIDGTFNGLGQGGTFNLNGFTASISYEGDFASGSFLGGNDVVISFTPVPEPLSVFGVSVAGLALGALARRTRP